jgi:hypothetical protein
MPDFQSARSGNSAIIRYKHLIFFFLYHIINRACARDAPSQAVIELALKSSGGNRAQLTRALESDVGADAAYLISNACQYDLVNWTADGLIADIRLARKTRSNAAFIPEGTDRSLWLQWVLNHRVTDEEDSDWRPELTAQLFPLVADMTSTTHAAETVLKWMWTDVSPGKPRIRMGVAENRLKSIRDSLRLGEGACGELTAAYVCMLRSVGIPARLCAASWYFNRDDRHFFCEYWDYQSSAWKAMDPSDNQALAARTPRDKVFFGNWNSLVLYAYPPHPPENDIYGKALWERFQPISGHFGNTFTLGIKDPPSSHASCLVWNHGRWMKVASTEDQGGGLTFTFGDNKRVNRPALFVSIHEGLLHCGLARPHPGSGPLVLKKAEPGECMTWNADGQPE